jgi:hypothetical protein
MRGPGDAADRLGGNHLSSFGGRARYCIQRELAYCQMPTALGLRTDAPRFGLNRDPPGASAKRTCRHRRPPDAERL